MEFKPSQKGFEALFDAVPDSLFVIDPDTSDIVFCNQAAHEELGYERHELMGHSVLSLQKDVTGLPQWSDMAQVIRQSQPYVFVGSHRHRDGHELAVEVLTSCVEIDGQEFFLSSARNVSGRNLLNADILDRQAHVLFALNEASDGLWDWKLTTNEVFFSPQLKRMLGYGPHEMSPTLESWSANVHAEDKERVFMVLDQHLQGLRERYEAQYRLKNRNGHYIWVNDRGRVCERDATGKPTRVVGMVNNITDQKTLEAHLMRQASHDSLTGLRNRRESDLALNTLISTCTRLGVTLGVCLFDIDHFKKINDVFGHLAGDQVLVRVAECVQQRIRASDSLYRWGGEEFLLLSPGLDTAGMACLAEKLRTSLLETDWTDVLGDQTVTASFGVVCMPSQGLHPTELLLAADTALYRAKAAGRNTVASLTD